MLTHEQQVLTYIGLGSNLGDRVTYLRSGVNAIQQLGTSVRASSVYESLPMGIDDEQPNYLNMVVSLRTDLSPVNLLHELLKIERSNGRIRRHPNAARTLDLDLLLMGDMVMNTRELTIPHPRMHTRAFVVLPMREISPDIVHPILAHTMLEIANRLPEQGIYRLGAISELA